MSSVVVQDLYKRYGDQTAVDGVSISVGSGQLCTLVGPSGCGKTTCLNMVAGFLTPDLGDIQVAGKSIISTPAHRRNTSMMFQGYALFPHMNVLDNVSFGLRRRKVPKAAIERRVKDMLELVQLADMGRRFPRELSGGQQQRVALARALVVEPSVLLLDEPLSNLDASLREQMREEIRHLQKTVGITTLYVTHDQDEALAISDQIVIMNRGRVEQSGHPQQIYAHPATGFVAGFIGAANILPVDVLSQDVDGVLVSVQDGAGEGQRLRLSCRPKIPDNARFLVVRPEHLRLVDMDSAGPHLTAEIKSLTFLGATMMATAAVGELQLRIRLSPDTGAGLNPAATVRLAVDPEKAVLVP